MKQSNILIGLIVIGLVILIFSNSSKSGVNKTDQAFSPTFIAKLKKCSPYTETIEPLAGIKLTSKVVGKEKGKCKMIYQDNTVCTLTKEQIKMISDGTNGIGPTTYTITNEGSSETITSDPLSIAITKLINDKNTCSTH